MVIVRLTVKINTLNLILKYEQIDNYSRNTRYDSLFLFVK